MDRKAARARIKSVSIPSSRIETFFWMFKNGLQARTWRVFSCWEAIDRLLTAAHMAYLLLILIAEFCQKGAALKKFRAHALLGHPSSRLAASSKS